MPKDSTGRTDLDIGPVTSGNDGYAPPASLVETTLTIRRTTSLSRDFADLTAYLVLRKTVYARRAIF